MWTFRIFQLDDWMLYAQALLVFLVPVFLFYISNWLRNSLGFRMGFQSSSMPDTGHKAHNPLDKKELSGCYSDDYQQLKEQFKQQFDITMREFIVGGVGARAVLVYVDGLIDNKMLDEQLMKPLMTKGVPMVRWQMQRAKGVTLDRFLVDELLAISELTTTNSLSEVVGEVLVGRTCFLMEGMPGALLLGSAEGNTRTTEEPLSESLLRGPRNGFTENLSDNTGILRSYGSNESLILKQYQVGTRIRKEMVIAYMDDIVNKDILAEVVRRIERLEIDAAIESGYIEQLIEDDMLTPFQQLHNTERPDRVIAGLLEGKIAILLDGTPFVLLAPITFGMLLQSPEDYYERWLAGSFIRLLRFIAATAAVLAPALYISFISFHPGLIPTKLVLTIIETRQGVPFPSIIEALIMEFSIEVMREAGIRLPRPIGPAMGIIGGIIVGDAAVQAGIVSPFLVIVVAVTAISSFSIPVYSAGITLRILRFVGMISAAIFGLYGVVIFFLLLFTHLVRLKSFGVPYISAFSAGRLSDWKDFLIRAPLVFMNRRPRMLKTNDEMRRSKMFHPNKESGDNDTT